jgi:hypothetical protein
MAMPQRTTPKWGTILEYGPSPPGKSAKTSTEIHSLMDLPHKPISGTVTIAVTGRTLQLITVPTAVRGVLVMALPTNTGSIKIGGPENAYGPLLPGAAVWMDVRDLSLIFVSGTIPGDIVAYLAEAYTEE